MPDVKRKPWFARRDDFAEGKHNDSFDCRDVNRTGRGVAATIAGISRRLA